MKKTISLVFICILFYCLITSCVALEKTRYSDQKEVTTKYGDELNIERVDLDFPDHEISIDVRLNGDSIFKYYGFSDNLSSYDYDNDFRINWYKIKNEYQKDSIKAYQFNWGIICSIDGGKTYSGVPKHGYSHECNTDETFKKIFNILNNS